MKDAFEAIGNNISKIENISEKRWEKKYNCSTKGIDATKKKEQKNDRKKERNEL